MYNSLNFKAQLFVNSSNTSLMNVAAHSVFKRDAKCPPAAEREFTCHKIQKKTYKLIVNITIVAGYQIGKPIKLVA